METEPILVRPIARIQTDFAGKFGVPRQSGLVPELRGRILFEPAFRSPEAVRGLEEFSHIWLLWHFSAAAPEGETFSPTVRPPRLGGNTRLGVFATRSPFRPNAIGLSCVRLERVEKRPNAGTVLVVSGADLLDGTPIYDIKPYLPYADCRPEASGGFAAEALRPPLRVVFPDALLARLPEPLRDAAVQVLAQDPRPSYQDDPARVYGFSFGGADIRFTVEGDTLTVVEVVAE
jgi:tRNA-Thr(GGU) m(6)t(6)A37 methyltransferase TsaA